MSTAEFQGQPTMEACVPNMREGQPTMEASLPTARPASKLYKRRHLVLLAYSFATATCGFYQNTFAPIADVYEEAFHDGPAAVSMYANIIPLLNIPISFLCPALFERRGLRFGCLLGALLLLAGGWVRYAGSVAPQGTRSWVIFVGQAIVAAGFPLLLAANPLVPNAWYSSGGRAVATAVASLAPILGSVLASIVAPAFFPPPAPGSSRRSQLQALFLAEAAMGTVSFLGMFMMQTLPPEYRSPKAELGGASPAFQRRSGPGLHSSVLEALRDRSFRLLMLTFGFGYGSLCALTTLINDLLKPIGYSDDDIGSIGACLGTGILGALVFGAIADATKEFEAIAKLCAALMLIGNAGFFACCYLPKVSVWWPCLAMGWLGFFATPVLPQLMELGVEVLFPMSETLVGSLLWAAGNAAGLVVSLIGANVSYGAGRLAKLPVDAFLAALIAAASGCMLLFRGRMRRRLFEEGLARQLTDASASMASTACAGQARQLTDATASTAPTAGAPELLPVAA